MASIIRLGARRMASVPLSRSISVSAVSKKDLVQDLYINQLKAYKPAPQSKDASASNVRSFNAPKPPTPPTLPSDLASELSKFDAEEPQISSASSSSASAKAAVATDGAESADEYLKFLEKDLPKADAHH